MLYGCIHMATVVVKGKVADVHNNNKVGMGHAV